MLCLVCLIMDSKSGFMASGFRIQDSGRGLSINILLQIDSLQNEIKKSQNSKGTLPCTFKRSVWLGISHHWLSNPWADLNSNSISLSVREKTIGSLAHVHHIVSHLTHVPNTWQSDTFVGHRHICITHDSECLTHVTVSIIHICLTVGLYICLRVWPMRLTVWYTRLTVKTCALQSKTWTWQCKIFSW